MYKMLLDFNKTSEDLKLRVQSFQQTILVNVLPEKGSTFVYHDWMLKEMTPTGQRQFKTQFKFNIGPYLVEDFIPYDRAVNGVDFTFFLVEN